MLNMMMIARQSASATRPVLDDRGRPIGQVVEPRTDRLTGRGAGTVLLVRGPM